MSNYRKISGVNVKSYSTDPDRTYPSGMEGNLYYNSSDGQFKYVGLGAAAWSSGGNLNTGRPHLGGFGATNSAHIATGGHKASAPNRYDLTEEYNGSAWSEVGDLNTAREAFGSAGATSTAGVIFSGYEAPPPSLVSQKTESWDGSSWTEVGDLNDQRYLVGGFVCIGCLWYGIAVGCDEYHKYCPGRVSDNGRLYCLFYVYCRHSSGVWSHCFPNYHVFYRMVII